MLKVGFVGWRGMVGSVLMGRMKEEGDFAGYEATFFSTSNVGGEPPKVGLDAPPLQDAFDTKLLSSLDIVVTCQGSGYTKQVYPRLREGGWKGYWVDSSSALRMNDDSIIVLDPVNRAVIDKGLAEGIKTYVGGNCTVSLMLMAMSGLFAEGLVEWISSMTYQAASGAGAKNMKELMAQMAALGEVSQPLLDDPASSAIELDKVVTEALR
ncbi:MAG: aspartate-semialdehyde dehydrogenase, partial [Deltaproteobacteria bacterium]